jgi:hypothetical protein
MADPEITEEVTEETPAESTEEQVETPEEVEEPEQEEVETEEEPEAPQMSRRKELRIQSLLSKLTGDSPSRTAPAATSGLKYAEALEADPETVKALEADRQTYGDQAYQRGVSQADGILFRTRLEIDTPRVEAKYPQFDKSSPQFNPVSTDAINRMYLSTVGFDENTGTVKSSSVRYSDYVDSIMELADEMAGEKVVKSQKNIAKQAAATGLRPGGSTPKRMNLHQAPQNMSDEELDAAIALGIPKK